MHKVILVQPPIQDFYLTKKRTLPYGLASIASSIRQKGFEVDILDALATDKSRIIAYPEEFADLKSFYGHKDMSLFSLFHDFRHFGYSFEHIGAQIKKEEPFIVGISSLFTAYADTAIKTAQTIKTFYPRCYIVMGGHHPTVFPEQVLSHTAVDFVIRGEGEDSMAQLCCALASGSDIQQIPGIAFRRKDSDPKCDTQNTHPQRADCHIAPPAWKDDLNTLPLPAIDLIHHEYYQRKKRYSAMVVSSRGCPMQCSYCCVSATSSYARFRQRNVEHVIKEIRQILKSHETGFIDFEDENLCLNKSWFMELFTQIKDILSAQNLKESAELRAMNGLFPPAIDEDIVCLMKDSGFKTLNLSLGSTSKDQLARFKRPDVRKSFESALSYAQKQGLECVSYIIAAGPDQNAQSSLDDLLYLAQKRTLVGLSVFYPAPGSLDYEICKTRNLLPDTFSRMRSTALPLDHTTSRREAVTLLRLSRILNFMKHILDTFGKIPAPKAFSNHEKLLDLNRTDISVKLLQWFLHDGKIRGVQPDGTVFDHYIDKDLALNFAQKIQTLKIAGIK
ncbi:MAG: B12-binding domain-containing radical SAM protein [Proteobacteria bacterium]|nr:B12-binding domain-containing radical SAM protein [Pseudomonadota bacterium]MBU1388769.1 B12-binding domain-containing radical SAM protein [Pseudomonadota bacterium]MBU1543110.1 B12-binding domain-containing radical SAM protein [Pseudomonadota bacterium]MBU2483162.1 B12-binding domain-containing radical SAM protein [Pseudomonadota bacterium]